ncbi:hypothetical protein TUM17576_43640 [Enterobacter hormaechei]|nr:hypothetical protein [Enterobacter hormaechei]GJL37544.1 hypothetical protein TUM17576_43640 [Enterobacter hormaechei]
MKISEKRLGEIAFGGVRQSHEEGVFMARALLDALAGDDYFSGLIIRARIMADKAMRKYPQPNYTLVKFGEESGEVTKAAVHYAEGRDEWDKVENEMVDTLAMMIRLLAEGDRVNGVIPPEHVLSGMRVHHEKSAQERISNGI